jgi:Ca2+-binding RTX toxin-like protein
VGLIFEDRLDTLASAYSQYLVQPTSWIFASPGNDTMQGGLGEDTIYGGTGTDHLYGGPGGDTFKFSLVADRIVRGEVDTIHDLESMPFPPDPGAIQDKIIIDFAAFKADLGAAFSSEFINVLLFTGPDGQKAQFKYSDLFAGFVFDHRTHDLVYDVGQETVIPLLHLNQEIDALIILGQTDTTITFGGINAAALPFEF